jgi:hypothetical protein
MAELQCHTRADRVDRLVHDLTAAEITAWLIEHHGLNESSRRTVEINLDESLRFHRLRGRIDRHSGWAALVELWLRVRKSRS